MRMFDSRPHRVRRLHRSAAAGVRPAQESIPDVAEHLRFIRDTMERSAAFTAVSGWGHVGIGATAIGAALLSARERSGGAWLRVWVAGGNFAVLFGVPCLTL